MNFKIKSGLQRFFFFLPKGELLNYVFQRYVSRSFPPDEKAFMNKVHRAVLHYNNFKQYNRLTTQTNRYYEFGAGWTLTIPLAITQFGYEVFCIDIRRLIIPSLIRDTLKKYRLYQGQVPFAFRQTDKVPGSGKPLLKHLEREYSLFYLAPLDARNTGFESSSFDFMSSTGVLEHIPKDNILPILNECYRLLQKGGVLSLTIDYQDHYSYFGQNISVYNFLKYSTKEWKKHSPALHYQNRLRHSDYLELIGQTGFEIVKDNRGIPNADEQKQLAAITLSEEFAGKSREDLGIKWAEIVLVK